MYLAIETCFSFANNYVDKCERQIGEKNRCLGITGSMLNFFKWKENDVNPSEDVRAQNIIPCHCIKQGCIYDDFASDQAFCKCSCIGKRGYLLSVHYLPEFLNSCRLLLQVSHSLPLCLVPWHMLKSVSRRSAFNLTLFTLTHFVLLYWHGQIHFHCSIYLSVYCNGLQLNIYDEPEAEIILVESPSRLEENVAIAQKYVNDTYDEGVVRMITVCSIELSRWWHGLTDKCP